MAMHPAYTRWSRRFPVTVTPSVGSIPSRSDWGFSNYRTLFFLVLTGVFLAFFKRMSRAHVDVSWPAFCAASSRMRLSSFVTRIRSGFSLRSESGFFGRPITMN